jgi:hypothetical protein
MRRSTINTGQWYKSMLVGNSSIVGDYEHIATALGTGSANTITFSSIPQNYKHLQVRFSAKCTTTGSDAIDLTMNGVTTATYGRGRFYGLGTGSAPSSENLTGQTAIRLDRSLAISTTTGLVSGGFFDFADYTNTTRNKAVKGFYGQQGSVTAIYVLGGFSFNTAAITSITFTTTGSGNNFATTTRFSLYGIR